MNSLLKLASLMIIPLTLQASEFDEFESTSTSSSSASTSSGISFQSMLELEEGVKITGKNYKDDQRDFVLDQKRFRLKTEGKKEGVRFYAKTDFVKNDVTDEEGIDIRELKLTMNPVSFMDLTVGRQVITWGVADMLFINDLFPKNWVANFQGRDMEYLKDTSDSIRSTNYFGNTIVDLVYTPRFTADTTPSGCELATFDPNTNSVIKTTATCGMDNSKDDQAENGEWAGMLKQKIGNHELALYGYRGFYKNPKSMQMDDSANFSAYYSRLDAYGASYEGQVGPGILSAEIGYYDSKEDPDGDQYLIENSTAKTLLGYKIDLSAHFTVGAQWYRETMMDYDAYEKAYKAMNSAGYEYRKKEAMDTYTLRLMGKFMQETLFFNLFSYIRPQDKDSFTKFDVTKKINNNLELTAGINVFTGKDNYRNREFGMLDNEDNAFMRLRFYF